MARPRMRPEAQWSTVHDVDAGMHACNTPSEFRSTPNGKGESTSCCLPVSVNRQVTGRRPGLLLRSHVKDAVPTRVSVCLPGRSPSVPGLPTRRAARRPATASRSSYQYSRTINESVGPLAGLLHTWQGSRRTRPATPKRTISAACSNTPHADTPGGAGGGGRRRRRWHEENEGGRRRDDGPRGAGVWQ